MTKYKFVSIHLNKYISLFILPCDMQQIYVCVCVCYMYTAATSLVYQNSCLTVCPFPACRAIEKITELSKSAQCYYPEDYSMIHSDSVKLL